MRADAAPTGKSFRFARRARGSSLGGFPISNVAPPAPGPPCARRWLGFGFGVGFGFGFRCIRVPAVGNEGIFSTIMNAHFLKICERFVLFLMICLNCFHSLADIAYYSWQLVVSR